jgi:hypothetical protein
VKPGSQAQVAAFDREAETAKAAQREEARRRREEKRQEQAERDATAPRDIDSLKPGSYIRDRWGWHEVVKVNRKSVSVKTPYPWTERIALDRIIETREGRDGDC